jgi:hypothetical protein
MHWAKRKRLQTKLGKMLWAAVLQAGASSASGRRRVMVERRGVRALDPDNLVAGCKPLLDELVSLRLLLGDSPDLLELWCVNGEREKGAAPSTVIIIKDCQ